jgi:hypothetical protein
MLKDSMQKKIRSITFLPSIFVLGLTSTFIGMPQSLAADLTEATSPDKTEQLLKDVARTEQKSRILSGVISLGIGATLAVVPQFSDSLESGPKALFALGGATSMLIGIRTLLVANQTETLTNEFLRLRQILGIDNNTRNLYEEAYLRQMNESAASSRKWNGIVALTVGMTSTISGFLQTNSVPRNISFAIGGLSILAGTRALLKRGATEELLKDYGNRTTARLSPTLLPDSRGRSALGMSLITSY